MLLCFGLTGATAEASGAGAFENAEQVPGHDGGGDACGGLRADALDRAEIRG